MLQKSLLFLQTTDGDKNYNRDLQFNSSITFTKGVHFRVLLICTLINMLGFIGNGIIFWLLCCTIRKTKYTIYVANLAAGDCLILLHEIIFELGVFTTRTINKRLTKVFLILFFFGHDNSSYFLAAISTERCLSVFFPVWYRFHRHKCSTAISCTFIWMLSVSLTMSEYFVCDQSYTRGLHNALQSCRSVKIFTDIVIVLIVTLFLVFSTLSLCVRMKIKPQQGFPARLDVSIWITVGLYFLFFPVTELFDLNIFDSLSSGDRSKLLYAEWIIEGISRTVNPIVYLLVGCWKWEKGQAPFYMFLERALKENRKGRMRTQSGQEQPKSSQRSESQLEKNVQEH